MKRPEMLVAAAFAIATLGLAPTLAVAQQTTGANTGNAGDQQYPSDESNNGNLTQQAYNRDRYGNYVQYYNWQTGNDHFDKWYGNSNAQWADWFHRNHNAYATSDEYGNYNSYYDWDTTTEYYDSWYGDSAEDWDDWFDHDTGLGYIGDSPHDSDIYWF
ncbi:MAG TPA: hypothetical protein VFK45_10440 [Gammaproteobacteria bacterium]|nr:hypothetical protein [Gammaproteobacteria bacterium]